MANHPKSSWDSFSCYLLSTPPETYTKTRFTNRGDNPGVDPTTLETKKNRILPRCNRSAIVTRSLDMKPLPLGAFGLSQAQPKIPEHPLLVQNAEHFREMFWVTFQQNPDMI